MTTNEKELAKAVYALTESLAASYTMQAALADLLKKSSPSLEREFGVFASGARTCASNLLRDLPPLETILKQS